VLFIRCIRRPYVYHGPAGPRFLRKMKKPARVIVDNMQAALAGPDIKVTMNADIERGAPHLRSRRARNKVEDTIIVSSLREIGDESFRLSQV
jgi:hypothetical protein